jgi:hypothetical protein
MDEVGTVYNDPRLHVVRLGPSGPRAACGAGVIATRVPGSFDPADERACTACADSVSPDPGSA